MSRPQLLLKVSGFLGSPSTLISNGGVINNEMTENVTFSGQEAEKLLSFDALSDLINALDKSPEPKLARITHNCLESTLLKEFGDVIAGGVDSTYYGTPVYRRAYVPLGEVWLQDKNGQVIKKFSLA